jgi:hypothetical protein
MPASSEWLVNNNQSSDLSLMLWRRRQIWVILPKLVVGGTRLEPKAEKPVVAPAMLTVGISQVAVVDPSFGGTRRCALLLSAHRE